MEYIVSSAKLGSFGEAANQCHISQPTISGQIKHVEQYLGVTIFERGRKGVIVTPEGRTVIDLAERILEPYQQLIALKSKHVPIHESTVKLGAFPTLGPYLFPKILPKIHAKYPKMQLHLIEEKTDTLLEQLLHGNVDIVLVALPINIPQLHVQKIFSEDFWLAAHKDHPLAQHTAVDMKELRHHRFMLLDEGHCLREHALDICKMAQASEHDEFRATSMETLKYMVAANTGITLVPEMAKSPVDNLCYIPFMKAPQRHIGMVWRVNSPYQDFYLKLNQYIRGCL